MSYNSGVEVLLNDGLNNQRKKAQFYNIEDAGAETLNVAVNSISFSNVGTVAITLNGYEIPVGSTVSFDAGGAENRFPAGTFEFDTTGGKLLIAYTW
jgi:hypothetical protein